MLVNSTILPPRITSNTILPSRNIESSNENIFITTSSRSNDSATTLIINDASAATSNTSVTESIDIHDELDTKISALEERFGNIIGARFNDLRDELGAKISALEERFANIFGAGFGAMHSNKGAMHSNKGAMHSKKRVNDTQNSFTTNSLTVNEINVKRWKISYESNVALVCRDMQGNGDKRYAMWNNKHVNL
ncbi:hypothetical protein F8M41_009004 [Gigaspora margarita]|uniref:Uncharacterized protein n=1 Tax=Gigaspora margarita TaxID=4874 RepID=A0A8H4AVI7_GIGMA|nr:hypothetical protein F8M41_009004 [Gigaspora margarita]